LLDENGIQYRYRDYREQPLTEKELRAVLKKLRVAPADVLRKRDKAYKELGLTGKEPAARLFKLMAKHPTLLERPIGLHRGKAALGRPPEKLLDLV
jgi:arsenate reductase